MWVAILSLVETLYVVGITAWLVRERRSPGSTVAWILAFAFMPIVGVILYFGIGPRRFERKRVRHLRARLKVRSQRHGEGEEPGALRAAIEALSPRWRQLVSLGTRGADASPQLATDAEIYTSGRACFEAMEREIRAARHHVHLLYYIFAPDEVGKRVRDLLIERAKAGVHVRLLVDAVGSASLNEAFLAPMRAAKIDVARFNRPRIVRFFSGRFRINFRNHRKILVCDGRVAFTGGLNVGDEYVTGSGEEPPWRDTHLRIEGPPVRWLQLAFLEDWQFATGSSPHGASYFPSLPSAPSPSAPSPSASSPPVAEGAERHLTQVIASGPDTDIPVLQGMILTAITNAHRRVYITTPYFVPDETIYATLTAAALRGVDVRVLLPRKNDSAFVAAAARSYYDSLLGVGVRIFEYLPTMHHAKTLVIDEELAMIGTANLDPRSMRLNFEDVVFLYSASFARELGEIFLEDLHQAEEVKLAARQAISPWQRLMEDGARLTSPLL